MGRIIIQGCKAGTLAGILWGFLLVLIISPLISEAEKFEEGAEPVDQVASTKSHQQSHAHAEDHGDGHSHGHDHHSSSWEPNTWQRPLFTVLGTVLLGISLGVLASLILVLGMKFHLISDSALSSKANWAYGMLFGLGGFLVFYGLPSLGLPPPLPGVIGADQDVEARQAWWFFCAFCTLSGLLALRIVPNFLKLEFNSRVGRNLVGLAFALIIMSLPFLMGVPQHSTLSLAPSSLNQKFYLASFLVNGFFWTLLGLCLFKFYGNDEKLEQLSMR